jgi:hypothetical protein
MPEKLLLINNSPNMELEKPQAFVSKDITNKLFPHLDLADPAQTQEKLSQFLKSLKSVGPYYEQLEDDYDPDELQEAYDAYIEKLQEILPTGYVLKEVSIPRNSDLWRGTDPLLIFSLLSSQDNKLKMDSDYPNVAHKWETSLSYGQPKAAKSALPFVLALGFKMPSKFKSKKRETSPLYKDVIETASGNIDFDDARELAIRFNGKRKGQIFPPKFYEIVENKQAVAA